MNTHVNLSQFQALFGSCLRTQQEIPTLHMPQRVALLYQQLIFNNIQSFLNQCFPICQEILGEESWQSLTRYFFEHYPLHHPYALEINSDFVQFLASIHATEKKHHLAIPDYLADLAHYEWIELKIDTLNDIDLTTISPVFEDYYLNPSVHNLHYSWAVHQISPLTIPTEPVDTFLLVYRNISDSIEFMELNAFTHVFIQIMQDAKQPFANLNSLIEYFSQEIHYPDIETLIPFATSLINEFKQKGILLTL